MRERIHTWLQSATEYSGNFADREHASGRRHPAISIVALCLTLMIFAGCQKQDAIIGGVDIPIPWRMTKVPDGNIKPIAGYEDGQVGYLGKMSTREIFEFYQENMEARGWKPTSFMVTKNDQLTYTKQDKICLVWYPPNPDGTTSLVIMVGEARPVS
jgi:hypothetical protein